MKHLLAVCLLLLANAAHAAETPAPLTVFAAASLTDALAAIGARFAATGHPKIVFSFASSSTLAKQIEEGAPASLFISADEKWMEELAKHNAIASGTRLDLLGNSLVLVEPSASLRPITLAAGARLDLVLGQSGRLAVGDPAHVPAGIYAQQALQKLGLWTALQARLAPADSVRSALRLVELSEAPAGIVYATDARISPKVGIAGTFPEDTHDPIRYPAAIIAAHDTPQARAFLAYLKTPGVRDIFTRYGFTKP